MKEPKYSILLPVHNGIKYIKECLDSIVNTNNENFELIISENKCDDGTEKIVEEYAKKYDFIKVYHTDKLLNQPENWSNAIKNASGEWVMLLGVDDALTPNCFRIADFLTDKADSKKINIIKTNRIYYFWDDEYTKKLYKNCHFSYSYHKKITIKKTINSLNDALYKGAFFEMPQMYTTCMFRNTLVNKIKGLFQTGPIIKYNSPDAYLGVAACLLESEYLYSEMPMAWVGTSSSSQGFRDSKEFLKNNIKLTKEEYLNFDAKTYKTINSAELLVVGAYKIIQQELNKPKILINEEQIVKNILYKKNIYKDEYFDNLQELSDAFGININEIKPFKQKNESKAKLFIIKCIVFIERRIGIIKTFQAFYDDKKTEQWLYSDINKLIKW